MIKLPIEKIPNNWRPEFPKAGFVVYYAPFKVKWFPTLQEAKEFALQIENQLNNK